MANLKLGLSIIEKMKGEGIRPDEVTFNTLMNIDSVTYEQGLSIIEKMKGEGIKPNEVTYSSLLDKVKTEENAYDWIVRFCSTAIIPNSYITSRFNKIFPFLNESPRLSDVFEIILRFNPIMFFNWLSNFEIIHINTFLDEYPELPNANDFNKLGFSSYYLNHDDLGKAKKFIDSVTNYDYYYFKYSGYYCYRIGEYEQAEIFYQQALSVSKNKGHRARMYDNLSLLIKELRLKNRIEEAIEYSKESIAIQPDNSPLAKQLLTYFTFEYSSIDVIPEKIEELKRFNIGRKTFKQAVKEISDSEKIKLIQNILNIGTAVKKVEEDEDAEEMGTA